MANNESWTLEDVTHQGPPGAEWFSRYVRDGVFIDRLDQAICLWNLAADSGLPWPQTDSAHRMDDRLVDRFRRGGVPWRSIFFVQVLLIAIDQCLVIRLFQPRFQLFCTKTVQWSLIHIDMLLTRQIKNDCKWAILFWASSLVLAAAQRQRLCNKCSDICT